LVFFLFMYLQYCYLVDVMGDFQAKKIRIYVF
jgi:hypothetical protein